MKTLRNKTTNNIISKRFATTKIFTIERHSIYTVRSHGSIGLKNAIKIRPIRTRRTEIPIPCAEKIIGSIVSNSRSNRDKKQGTAKSDQRSAGP